MRSRFFVTGCIVAFMLGLVSGCKKPSAKTDSAAEPETLARVHWLGKKRVAAQKDAAYLMGIWGMPQAGMLEAELLDKLSLAPWSISEGWKTNNLRATNAITALLRSVAVDALEQESYTEIRQPRGMTNELPEIVMAVRLTEDRARTWETNLASFLSAAAETAVEPSLSGGWTAPWPRQLLPLTTNTASVGITNVGAGSNTIAAVAERSTPPRPPARTLTWTRVGPWTLFGLGGATNSLLSDFRARIRKDNIPFPEPKTNFWLSVDLAVAKLNKAFALGIPLPANFPRIQLNWFGEGEFVLTRGQFVFEKPVDLPLEPWQVPTNLIREPLVSFTAIRGYRPWLTNQTWVKEFGIAPVPNQTFVWSQKSSPVHFYTATPMPGASNLLASWNTNFTARVNPLIAEDSRGSVEYSAEHNGFTWLPMPFVTPTIEANSDGGLDYLIARLSPALVSGTNKIPQEFFGRLGAGTHTVYYDWDDTQHRVGHWVLLGQSARILFWFPQVAAGPAVDFLVAVAPKLGNTATEVVAADSAHWTFARRSHSGLTGFEWQLFADWVASPRFPGLPNTLATEKLPMPKATTNGLPRSITIPVR